ncbi:MBL fold metallo-hydrolase [Wenjunlia tyrosinilytica]|jgi:L-ascorbate metabolism protein UlaG (beta-lactamase superfamily)|uniref:MBL fold metallo-hydrolase n=1 Tax=Wenjunlia tyrosinilytica TaxID=1544741 RepID=A0A917ZV90_9ACTN|nr:MBL fold metallo-hydrolase [Wenjunlia tyrosinilytica]GGO91946.1 MBL fold metallo-hydrolase [Wenjunlia tyrosinilytica]
MHNTPCRHPGARSAPNLRPVPCDAVSGAFPAPAGTRADEVALWWLGQAGFALRHRERLLLIDPYLSDTLADKYRGTLFPHVRMHPVPVAPDTIRGVTAVLCTHGHTDHMDPGTIRALLRHNDPRFVVPRAERKRALERGVPATRLTGTTAGERLELDGITVQPVPAAHERLEQDENGDHRFLGYVLTIAGIRVYHSGDCVPYDGQAELLRDLRVDLALLPVNGRDAYRTDNGVPGNFTVQEAAELCETAGIPRLLCHHFGLFDFNTVDPDDARDELRRRAAPLSWTVPDVGGAYVLTPGDITAKEIR